MSKLKNPLQATGHQICNETGRGIFDPRGNRQVDAQVHPFGSLPAEITEAEYGRIKLPAPR